MLIVEKTEDFFKKLKLPKIQPLPQNTNFFIFIYTLPDDFPWRYIYIYVHNLTKMGFYSGCFRNHFNLILSNHRHLGSTRETNKNSSSIFLFLEH